LAQRWRQLKALAQVAGSAESPTSFRDLLMSCPRNKHAFRPAVAGSVGRFSRRERRAYLNRYVRSESRGRGTEKQPTGRGPEGCDENGPAAVPRLRDRLRIALDMRPPRALPAAHFDRNERLLISGTGHQERTTTCSFRH